MKKNVLGRITPSIISEIFQTGYVCFHSPFGIEGLAKESGTRLDLLAVVAAEPGTGQFRSFLKASQRKYQTVCVWQIHNPVLAAALGRYGFTPDTEIDRHGVPVPGMRWDKSAH